MTSRREFLGFGIATVLCPTAAVAGQRLAAPAAAGLPTTPLLRAIYDVRFPPSIAFAGYMRRHGIAVDVIDADITDLWFKDLSLHWREAPAAIAGLTAPEALFCLEQLAWEHRMRTVFRVEHRCRAGGVIGHRARGPQTLLRKLERLGTARAWSVRMAQLCLRCPAADQLGAGTRSLRAWTEWTDDRGVAEQPLVSWVIAPVSRT